LTRAQTGAPLSDCHINNAGQVHSDVTLRETLHGKLVDNSCSTSCSIISCLGLEIFVQINRILNKFCYEKIGVPVIMAHCVQSDLASDQ